MIVVTVNRYRSWRQSGCGQVTKALGLIMVSNEWALVAEY